MCNCSTAVSFEPSQTLVGPLPIEDEDLFAIIMGKDVCSIGNGTATVIAYRKRNGGYISHGHSLPEAMKQLVTV